MSLAEDQKKRKCRSPEFDATKMTFLVPICFVPKFCCGKIVVRDDDKINKRYLLSIDASEFTEERHRYLVNMYLVNRY